jgi:hypothetical protein
MNRTAITKALTGVFLLALLACSSKRTAGDSSPARNANEEAMQAAQTAQGLPGEGEARDASTLASQKDTPPVNSGDTPAEVILRDGTVMQAYPSMSTNSYLSGPGFWVDRSKVRFIWLQEKKVNADKKRVRAREIGLYHFLGEGITDGEAVAIVESLRPVE